MKFPFAFKLISAALLAVFSIRSSADDSSIHGVTVGPPVPVSDNNGDSWTPAWTRNGSLYSPSDDTKGFGGAGSGNIAFSRISGQPDKLTGKTVNYMPDYGAASQKGADGCTWKSSGCLALDGALYWVIARHMYGAQQAAHNSSIIKSLDSGKTWTRAEKENYDHPMFPGSGFATPFFVNYGQEGKEAVADQSDRYVYAVSNNGFWDNGDSMVLGRVLRSKIANLSGADWQYFTHGDGSQDGSWSSNVSDAKPVLAIPNHLGMTGATYLPAQQCYLMIGWYYPAGGGKKAPDACQKTNWDFYVASHPWGPWHRVGSHTWFPQGYYSPAVCPKFTSPDGSALRIFTAGNWNNSDAYRLTVIPLTIK